MQAEAREAVVYPTSDGKPMAENTLQYQWITTLKGHIDATLPDFVAGDLLWYPVEGDNTISRAPDVLVAFGRPKGHRGSYLQWLEDGVAPQVVIEVLSPSNTARELRQKHAFYSTYGVQEYLVIDPDRHTLQVGLRDGGPSAPLLLRDISTLYKSERLGLVFKIEQTKTGPEIVVTDRSGEELLTFEQLHHDRERQRRAAQQAEWEKRQAQSEKRQAEERAARLAERLRELGLDPDQI